MCKACRGASGALQMVCLGRLSPNSFQDIHIQMPAHPDKAKRPKSATDSEPIPITPADAREMSDGASAGVDGASAGADGADGASMDVPKTPSTPEAPVASLDISDGASDASAVAVFSRFGRAPRVQTIRSAKNTRLNCHRYRAVLMRAQETMLRMYLTLGQHDVFGQRVHLTQEDAQVYTHPVQDIFGTFYTACIILRMVTIVDSCVIDHTSQLTLLARMQLAAVLTFSHKLCSSAHGYNANMAMAALQSASSHWELPSDIVAWQRWLDRHRDLEFELLTTPSCLSIMAETPHYYMNQRLDSLVAKEVICPVTAVLLKSGAAFFLGSCFFNKDFDLFESLLATSGMKVLGDAVASVLVTCYAESKTKATNYKLRGLGSEVDRVALTLIRNAREPSSLHLRVGVYLDDRDNQRFVHPIQDVLTSKTLRRAHNVFSL